MNFKILVHPKIIFINTSVHRYMENKCFVLWTSWFYKIILKPFKKTHNFTDLRTAKWFLVEDPFPPFMILISYLTFCAFHKKIASFLPKYDLKYVMMMYNFFLVTLSMYMAYEVSLFWNNYCYFVYKNVNICNYNKFFWNLKVCKHLIIKKIKSFKDDDKFSE